MFEPFGLYSLLIVRTLGVAASTRVGNLIGARSARGAKRASHASAFLSVVVGTVVMIILIATKDVSLVVPRLSGRAPSELSS